jgi:hypothetical protein
MRSWSRYGGKSAKAGVAQTAKTAVCPRLAYAVEEEGWLVITVVVKYF